ncbi:MAG: hypothetical protein A2941_00290 [Candidatus Yanofskybacteria bacterium RIFCSPLOWO2_01_FULL_49_17]|uniref:Isoleucine--tRNA ligase n=1 Tax=Candidatus Yanofskybacteria bacterium RIFCSPLOWO2_01_FULL_49_17 TaxID=1802700 RepID=A0A1F8GPI5_9BACT|nr:MAG: hypothetical protein A2941_00290 [Candidatus Yanofskybacteria bacterium RIFCSPLOWO2_01_FULL_49_17]
MYDFKKVEQDIAHFWKEQDIFEKSLEKTRKGKRFVFWEGPPTANGQPHVGHFLTRIYKDLYGRYKTMRGFFVLRKAGWDTHGLPVEIEVEKELGFNNKKQIEEFGIAKFNRKCRESTLKYKGQWEEMSRRMGFWLDMKHPYITYETNYTESVWNILAEFWKKELLYKAHKVVPFCVRCGTPLSAHEVSLGYKRVTDTSVIVKFKIINFELLNKNLKLEIKNSLVYILAWTTTPWTLPGNVALAVGKDIDYVVVEQNGENLIVAKDLVGKVFGSAITYKLSPISYKGRDLVGLEYKPLFDIAELKSPTAHKVYDADFVSTQDGTGVVHTAVMYGEDDYNLGTKLNLPKFHTVDEQGKFTEAVGKDLAGRYVKDPETEKLIIKILNTKYLILNTVPHEHDYPFCWRCNTPLLYYAKSSWFIKTSALNKELLANNATVNWIPEHVREGRFGQWLREGKDWALSRERYWGTPLPIWQCQIGKSEIRNPKSETNTENSKTKNAGCGHTICVGSIKELEKLSVGPKNTYYVMRHGYTNRNEGSMTEAIVSTKLESDTYHLTEDGKAGVQQALELLKLEGIDVIYTSPFHRTKETAQIAARILHKEVITDNRLVDISEGIVAEGKSISSATRRKTPQDKPVDGESWNDVRVRAMDFMKELETKHKNKKILIISHQDTLWLIDAIGKGLTAAEVEQDSANLENFTPGRLREVMWRKIPRNEYGELDLHRPFIDDVIFKCPKCKSKMRKIPDLIDVWFDSGAMPYAQWHYPFENKDIFKKQFPADFIVEGVDQTRGWFYTLLAISTLLGRGAPYKNVMSLGLTLDEKGQKMSKSKGNYVPVPEMMNKHGVDILRWYFASSMTIGEDKAVIGKEIDDKLKGFFFTFQNCVKFYELYAANKEESVGKLTQLDKWLLSRFNRLLASVTEKLDKYDITSASRELEQFVIEDLSNWWVRRSRKRREALPLLRSVLLDMARVLAPFTPFMAEDIWRRLSSNGQVLMANSVHLADWPKVVKKYLDEKLEAEMQSARDVITRGLALRKEKQVKVRQPLALISISQKDKFRRDIEGLIKDELNVKMIKYEKTVLSTNQEGNVPVHYVSDISFNFELTPALVREGYAREVVRTIQDMRKEAKYKIDESVTVHWHTFDNDIAAAMEKWGQEIMRDTMLGSFERVSNPSSPSSSGHVFDVEKESELAPGKKIWLGIKK